MLHLLPDLVDMSKAENFHSLKADLARDFEHLTGTTRIAWQAQDLNPAGVVGNARDADADRGAQLIDHAAAELVALLKEIHRYPLSNVRQGPLERRDRTDQRGHLYRKLRFERVPSICQFRSLYRMRN